MPPIIPQSVIDDYIARRRKRTEEDIDLCQGNRDNLALTLELRRDLAKFYAEDGAVKTARCIETIDIPLIEEAIRAAA